MVSKYHIVLSCISLLLLIGLFYISVQYGYSNKISHEKRGTCLINSIFKYGECTSKCYVFVNYTLINNIPNGTVIVCNISSCVTVQKFYTIMLATNTEWIHIDTESYFYGWYNPGKERLCWYNDQDIQGSVSLDKLNLGIYGLWGACFIGLAFMSNIVITIFLIVKLKQQGSYKSI